MKILEGVVIAILSLIPWTWMFTYHLWVQPVIGDTGGQISVGVVAAVVLALGIYATRKGYGRQATEGTTKKSKD